MLYTYMYIFMKHFSLTYNVYTSLPPHQQTSTVEILMLLKWRQKEQNLGVVLTNLSHISGEEVVKFLQDTLDCLFEILNNNSDTYGDKVFDVLVSGCGHTTVTCTHLHTLTQSHITCTHSHCHTHTSITHTHSLQL